MLAPFVAYAWYRRKPYARGAVPRAFLIDSYSLIGLLRKTSPQPRARRVSELRDRRRSRVSVTRARTNARCFNEEKESGVNSPAK